MAVSRFDLNLFVVFDAIYTQQSLTKAAGILHVTQPAISSSLARLRERFDDPLFVRTPAGMTPTPLARTLIEPVRRALETLDDCITARLDFNPAQAKQVFRLHATEQAEMKLLPALLKRLHEEAPGIDMEVVFMDRREVPFALASGHLHAAVDAPLLNQSDLLSQPLQSDHYVCTLDKNHPLAGGPLQLEDFLAAPQIHVSSRLQGAGHIDLALRAIGRKRRIALRLQHYTALPRLLQGSSYIAAVPSRLAADWSLARLGLPFDTPRLDLQLFWHKSVDADPASRWLRTLISSVL